VPEQDELDVEVRLTRDHTGPGDYGDTVPAGTWVTGWMRRSDWRRRDGRWEALVRYSVTHRGTSFNYMATFDQDDIHQA
jgi:hypothetical protein